MTFKRLLRDNFEARLGKRRRDSILAPFFNIKNSGSRDSLVIPYGYGPGPRIFFTSTTTRRPQITVGPETFSRYVCLFFSLSLSLTFARLPSYYDAVVCMLVEENERSETTGILSLYAHERTITRP